MARAIAAVAAVLLALCGVLWSGASRAGRDSASFGVTVRVLPRCDETRHGGLSETQDGRMVCIYPKIRQQQVDQDMLPRSEPSTDDKQGDDDGSPVIRTIEY